MGLCKSPTYDKASGQWVACGQCDDCCPPEAKGGGSPSKDNDDLAPDGDEKGSK